MDEYKTEKAVYTPNDFVLWQEKNLLELTPKFQRRSVWKTPSRSYFIDTILRGMTVPPIYLRMAQNADKTSRIREVVDGQQRVRSVLDFISEKYRLSKSLKNSSWANKYYTQLTTIEQNQIMYFSFSAEVFQNISDKQILEVFCRLNMNGVPLNKQELRNGKFFGYFKEASFDLALDNLQFWRKNKIFSEQSIARMLEVELTSELLVAGISGMQDKKDSLDNFYEKWEIDFPEQKRSEKRFNEVISTISDIFEEDDLAESAFRRVPLFYTLYCVIYHHMFGLPGVQQQSPKKRLGNRSCESLKEAVFRLSDVLTASKEPSEKVASKYSPFVLACQRQTDNINPRKIRFGSLYEEAF